jgi:hypothetical protein
LEIAMWKRRFAVIAAAITMVATATGVAAARAAGPGAPFYGDLNGDRLTDRATLAPAPPDRCAVAVRWGRPGGSYGPAETHTYPAPSRLVPAQCPDLGVIVDLGRDGSAELVVGWFAGRPPGVGYDLLVLRNFQPSGGFAALFQPSAIGTADFNGDGRKDVYEWTDQGEGFATYLNTAAGALVPGPLRFCAGQVSSRLADFDRDGAMDVAVSYLERCGDGSSGVGVALDNGSVLPLQQDPTGSHFWTADVEDADGNGVPDLRTVDRLTGKVSHFITVAPRAFAMAPTPKHDVVTATIAKKVAIPVLANDAVTLNARVTIVTPPRYGRAVVTQTKTVIYIPPAVLPPGSNTDKLVYQVVDDGVTARAAVVVCLRP